MLQTHTLYNGKEVVKFDDERHIFYDPKGKTLISVTGATGVVDKSGALMGWAIKLMGLYLIQNWDIKKVKIESDKILLIDLAKKEYRKVKEAAADIGTEIHDWISHWIKDNKLEMPEDEKVVNGITAFLKFQKEHKIKWLESEIVVYSKKYHYAGILDAIGEMDGKLTLFDFKSSSGVYPEMYFQVAGYQIAREEETKKKFDNRVIVRFGKEDGEFEVVDLGKDGEDKKAFLACLQLKKRLDQIKHK